MYNQLVRSRMRMREAWSGIEVQLKRRASLVPNLVETVKGYAVHERGLFAEVTRARSALHKAGSVAEAAEANLLLTQMLGRLLAVAEKYPELRASEQFLKLQEQLFDVEEKIAYARQFYNQNVLAYNTRTATLPHLLVARLLAFRKAEFFEAEEESRVPVAVVLGGRDRT